MVVVGWWHCLMGTLGPFSRKLRPVVGVGVGVTTTAAAAGPLAAALLVALA